MNRLRTATSFLNTGAHPDDETSGMLAALSLGQGVRCGFLCANRGEGGQNSLARESGADLGTIRTAEMEQAAAVLDMSLYWLSQGVNDTIFDFRFSKSAEETFAHWGRERTLERIVRAYRHFKPDIVCPTFLDVPGQHGHHRAMTRAAFDAIALAADPNYPCDVPDPWPVQKFYLPAWSGAGDSYDDAEPPPPATIIITADMPDPASGLWYQEVAEISRGYHATQGMGRDVAPGSKNWPLYLAWSSCPSAVPENSLLDGLPVTLGELDPSLTAAQKLIDELIGSFGNIAAMDDLARAALSSLDRAHVAPEHGHRIARKQLELRWVMAEARDVLPRAIAHRTRLAPGERTKITLPPGSTLLAPPGWKIGDDEIAIPKDAIFTDPYPDHVDPLVRRGLAGISLNGINIELDLAEPITILPAKPVSITPEQIVINRNAPPAHIDVSLTDGASLVLPHGWTLDGNTLAPPHRLETGTTYIDCEVAGTPAQMVRIFDFPHIETRFRTLPTKATICTIDVNLPTQTRIAYAGSGHDLVDQHLRAIGLDVVSLDHVNAAILAPFTTLLVGIFAFGSRHDLEPDLLRQWVRDGGHLVTLYHRPKDGWDPQHTPPLPIEIGTPSLRWRVTDKDAAIRHLDKGHLLLNSPNLIGHEQWSGWVKERGLYFAKSWDDAYTPLLAMADPDEGEHRGALLSARIGRGRHTHTSLALHTQLNSMVPGAFCLMSNLVQSCKNPS